MGWRDDLARGARAAARAAATGLSRLADEAETRTAARAADDYIEKAARAAAAAGRTGEHDPAADPKALGFDPFDLVAAMGYRDKPTNLSYEALERVGRSVPVVADVVRVRATQVATFCKVPEDRHAPGFEVRLRDRKAKVTKAVETRADELTQMALRCGWVQHDSPFEQQSLQTVARQLTEDSLIYDQATFEIIPDRKGDPSYILPVDASTIRLIDPGVRKRNDPYAVQVVSGAIVSDFTPSELAFCVRNPRTGIRSFGYGVSETETLVREITGFLWGIEYNRKVFSNGSTTKGVLNIKGGAISEKQMQAFRRQWYAMVSGIANAWRTPITNAEGLEWVNLQMSNRDMEFSAWLDFLIKVVCARFLIAPEEVQFSYGNTGQSQAMGQAPIEEKLKASRDLGLRPLVYWLFDSLNRWWIHRVDEDFEIVPVGLEAQGEQAEASLLKEQTGIYLTIDEAREVVGLKPLGDDKGGDAILNPTWVQWMGQKAAAQQQDDGMGPPGSGPPDSSGDFEVGDDDGDAAPTPQGAQGEQGADTTSDFDIDWGGDSEPEPEPTAKAHGPTRSIVVDV